MDYCEQIQSKCCAIQPVIPLCNNIHADVLKARVTVIFSIVSDFTLLYTLGQDSSSAAVTAELTVVRFKGRFSNATVSWMLIGQSTNLVLSPRQGVLVFPVDQSQRTIDIQITGTRVCNWKFQ